MNTSKKDFPIQNKWLLKPVITGCWGSVTSTVVMAVIWSISLAGAESKLVGLGSMGLFLILIFGFALLGMFFSVGINAWKRATFDFSFEENFIVLHQGIITRSQRNIPYAVIQHVILKQGFIDRYLLGLTTIMIENAVQDASAMVYDSYARGNNRYQIESIGFMGNRVTIPGLSNADAQKLKTLVLTKMKQNQVHPSVTGM